MTDCEEALARVLALCDELDSPDFERTYIGTYPAGIVVRAAVTGEDYVANHPPRTEG